LPVFARNVELSLQKKGKMPEEREKLSMWRIGSKQ